MKNLYAQFKMQPPSKDTLARRLTSAPSATPVAVKKSLAPKDFYNRVEVPMGQPLVQMPYSLGSQNGLSGFGGLEHVSGFGALAGDTIVEGITFNHVWSMEDLTASTQRAQSWLSEVSGGPRGLEYQPQDFGFRPIQPSLLTAARGAYGRLSALSSQGIPAAIEAVRKYGDKLQNAAREVDATWDGVRFGITSRSPDLETRRTSALKTIVKTLNDIINDERNISAAVEKTNGAGGGGGGSGAYVRPGLVAAGSGGVAQLKPTSGGISPLVLGLGAAALIVGVLAVRKATR